MLVVDPATGSPVAPGSVGEIWISSPSVAQGYWRKPEISRNIFQAQLARTDLGGHEGRAFLRSGDLGIHPCRRALP